MVPDRPRYVPPREASDRITAPLTAAIREFGPAKVIARAARCAPVTAQRWRTGARLPHIIHLSRLAVVSQAVRDVLMRMIGADDASLDATQLRLEHESERDRAETLRIGGSPDVQPDKLEGTDEGRGTRRRG